MLKSEKFKRNEERAYRRIYPAIFARLVRMLTPKCGQIEAESQAAHLAEREAEILAEQEAERIEDQRIGDGLRG
jgi:hypothetical protein